MLCSHTHHHLSTEWLGVSAKVSTGPHTPLISSLGKWNPIIAVVIAVVAPRIWTDGDAGSSMKKFRSRCRRKPRPAIALSAKHLLGQSRRRPPNGCDVSMKFNVVCNTLRVRQGKHHPLTAPSPFLVLLYTRLHYVEALGAIESSHQRYARKAEHTRSTKSYSVDIRASSQ